MKKIMFSLLGTALLTTKLFAPFGESPTQNTILVENLTNEEFTVCVHETNHDNRNHVTIEPGEARSFLAGSTTRINGPLHFALSKDMQNKQYSYYETAGIFPIMFYEAQTAKIFGIKKIGPQQYVITPGNIPTIKRETTQDEGF